MHYSLFFKTKEAAYAYFHAYVKFTAHLEFDRRREMGVTTDGVHGTLYINPCKGGFSARIGA